jgi:hypothetical protein
MMLQHHAALALGKLTRVPSGVNLPPSEVIMSRRCAEQTSKKHQRQPDRKKGGDTMKTLAGKVALVTGGSHGIGVAMPADA